MSVRDKIIDLENNSELGRVKYRLQDIKRIIGG